MEKLTEVDKDILIAYAKNNMCTSETARNSYWCRNTIVYHLERVKSKTGLNPCNFFQLVKLLQNINALKED